jgi:GDP-L-fucose synthase
VERQARIFVAGHRGLVGSTIADELRRRGYHSILTADHRDLDLTDQARTFAWFDAQRPDVVLMCAAKVGGILANATYPGEFIGQNLMIQTNIFEASRRFGVTKVLFMGSGCIYPRMAPQPIKEEYLLTGPLEITNEWYAVAKIAGIKMGQAYRRQYGLDTVAVMPANLYGPGDNFDLEKSHVVPALMRKVHEAKMAGSPTVTVWGTGQARREFLYIDDLADACVFLLESYSGEDFFNIGIGIDHTIDELATTIIDVVGYRGRIVYDRSKPDGTPRKLLDCSRLHALGWKSRTPLREGLRQTYAWYLENVGQIRLAG